MTDEKKPEYVQMSEEEMSARNKRNIAMAVALFGFMLFVFFSMLLRTGAIG